MLPIAFALHYALALNRFPGRMLLDALVHLPLVIPPVVTGYLLLLLFGRNGPVGGWLENWFGITVMFRWTGAAIAAGRSEEHTSELQSLMRLSYAVFCLNKKIRSLE